MAANANENWIEPQVKVEPEARNFVTVIARGEKNIFKKKIDSHNLGGKGYLQESVHY